MSMSSSMFRSLWMPLLLVAGTATAKPPPPPIPPAPPPPPGMIPCDDDDCDDAEANAREMEKNAREMEKNAREAERNARQLVRDRGLHMHLDLGGVFTGVRRDDDGRAIEASTPVKGPITLHLEGVAVDVRVAVGKPGEARILLADSEHQSVRIVQRGGDRYEVESDGAPGIRTGSAVLQLPSGSSVDLTTVSGDVAVAALGGNVTIRSASGDVHVGAVANLDVHTVNGDVEAESVAGEARVQTVSGDVRVVSVGKGGTQEIGTTSGDVAWSGRCGAGCKLRVRTTSGDTHLALDAASSLELRFLAHDGEFSDELGMTGEETRKLPAAATKEVHVKYGAGEGYAEVSSFSGDLAVSRK